MKPVNLPSGAQRNAEVGLVWRQVHTGAAGATLIVPPQSTLRVSAGAADVTVTIGGVLAATLRAGEVEYFNSGLGPEGDGKTSVEVVIGASDARVQIAEETDTKARRNK